MLKVLSLLIFCTAFVSANDDSIKKIFENYKIDGTLIITDLKSDKLYLHNSKRADTRFSPASTFKIAHTLILLNENIIKSQDEIIKWDKVKRAYNLWNKDQTLATAVVNSCVWCFKRFSKKVSKETYLDYLKKFNYGNKIIGDDKSNFWLDSSLKISTFEQIDFLKKIYTQNLPILEKNISMLKDILTIQKDTNFQIKAKSGWDGQIGWYVGYVKTKKDIYFFALNADIKKEQLNYRKQIVYEALKIKNIIDFK